MALDSGGSSVTGGSQDAGGIFFNLDYSKDQGGMSWLPVLVVVGIVALALLLIWKAL